MFNNKKASKSSNKPNNMPAINIISEDTKIEGTLNAQSDFRIAGTIKGHVKSENKVVLTSTSHIEGDMTAKEADISGKVEGELFIKEKLILRKQAVVKGDINTKSLLVEEGAQFDGICKMGDGIQNFSGSKNNGQDKPVGKKLKMNTDQK